MSKAAKTFKELVVWQKAHEFVLTIYHLTATFPAAEIYCLTTQVRRAAISIAANIAEGFKKRGSKDKTNLEIFLEEVSKLLSAYSLAVGTNKRGMRPSDF